jgi:hypothetical protein
MIENIYDESGERLQVKEILILEDLSEFLVLDKKKKNLQKKRLKLLKKNSP